MKDNSAPFNNIARRALAEYNREDLALTFIQHSENVTFKAEHPSSEAFLLRIHVPVTTAMGTYGADYDVVNSELLWLEALCQDTDLVLQEPVRNREGRLVTQVSVENGGTTVNCTMLHWLDGQPYSSDLEPEQTVRQIGEILATLHLHASRWEIPQGFRRPKRDIAYFEDALQRLRPALADGRVNASDFAILETSIALLTDIMRGLNESGQTYGVIHADAHDGNMLYHQGRIRLIDFSACAMGNFMYDLGICLSSIKEPLHRVFLDGYQSVRVLPDGYQHLIEGFFVGSDVGMLSYWVSIPKAQEGLTRYAPKFAREYAVKFNRGEFFWFSL